MILHCLNEGRGTTVEGSVSFPEEAIAILLLMEKRPRLVKIMTMMWIYSVRKLKRKSNLLKNAQKKQKHLQRRKSLVLVGYEIKKLQIMMTIVDDLVSVDTLIEERLCEEPINEIVQSCDIVALNKLCFVIVEFDDDAHGL
ncbi:unnamed protein product [Lactuca virosa]|uniref:Translation elongation factor EF1B beta/delta subunit guanine nucleotide exchange domain-containing protein n=1 Tax=Lactuca virosa TaxID=75947 RepID=A0AAU9PKG5_9ASTR|nr:unnamed protein product [Lactuca virosa]